MKPILVLNPNTSVDVTEAIRLGVSRARAISPVVVANVPWGPVSVESEIDSMTAANAFVETVWAQRAEYAAFVVACFDDPGLRECRELTRKPVVGIGQAAILYARERFRVIGVLVVADRVRGRVVEHFSLYGVSEDRLIVAGLDGSVTELNETGGDVLARFAAAARDLAGQGAECVVLACAGFSHAASTVERVSGLPVVDGNELSVTLAQEQILANVDHSEELQEPQPFRGERPRRPPWA